MGVLTDTAGRRVAGDVAERIGVERARAAARGADLILELRDCRSAMDWRSSEEWKGRPVWRLATKTDLLAPDGAVPDADIAISAHEGTGLDELISRIDGQLEDWDMSERTVPTRPRHLDHLGECVGALARARAAIGELELCAEELRIASDALGRLTGAVDVEELLGVIFSTFCIGK
jgi:tRNA modification GTPase